MGGKGPESNSKNSDFGTPSDLGTLSGLPNVEGQMKILHVGAHQFRESLRDLLRELWFSCFSSRGMPF